MIKKSDRHLIQLKRSLLMLLFVIANIVNVSTAKNASVKVMNK
ncbi:MAG: hypothetical protein QNJ70_29955 [Xenococcaceae cyanobacterium MO_207.B15]|nr:hypothetical protein [Xenococcaceae cyanobacterium MO_207.B15]